SRCSAAAMAARTSSSMRASHVSRVRSRCRSGGRWGMFPACTRIRTGFLLGGMVRRKVEYLTGMQERILSCIRQAITEDGEAPTVGEIADRVGLKSWSSVHYQLRELEAKGAIVREPGRARGIRLA